MQTAHNDDSLNDWQNHEKVPTQAAVDVCEMRGIGIVAGTERRACLSNECKRFFTAFSERPLSFEAI
jgi:hypothetical protein